MIRGITFDAYGTLLDPMATTWDAISEILIRARADADAEAFFGAVMERVRLGLQGPGFYSYMQLYREALVAAYEEFGVVGTPEDAELIFTYSRRRKPYPEVAESLTSLQRHFKTGIISNTDISPLRWNLQDAGFAFEFVIASEKARAYKPTPSLFEAAIAMLSLQPGEMAHVGDSPREDVAPAKALGMTAIWINRHKAAYPPDIVAPDHTITSLAELETLLR